MSKSIKIIYEDVIIDAFGGITQPQLKWSLVDFGDLNTEYLTLDSYQHNFERFIQDCFDCGSIYLSKKEAIPVWQVKKFIANDDTEKPNKPKKKSKQQKPQQQNKKNVKPSNRKTSKVKLNKPNAPKKEQNNETK